MSKNKYSQAQKKKICDKHEQFLSVVFWRIGFEKILQQQAIEIALLFRFYPTERDVKMAIQELEKYQLIKKIPTVNSNKFLILCKYARAYVRGIEDSQKVAAFDSSMTPATQFDRIARVQLLIEHIKVHKKIKSLNTYIVREDLTHEFYDKLIKLNHQKLNKKMLEELYDKALTDFKSKPGTLPENYQKKEKKKFNFNTDMVTLRQLIQKKIYLENINQNDKHLIFKFSLVDANNRYTPRKFKENVMYIQKFVDQIFVTNFGTIKPLVEINYICTDEEKTKSLQRDMNHRVWDNANARYKGITKIEELIPQKTLQLYMDQEIHFKTLNSNYFKIHKNLE